MTDQSDLQPTGAKAILHLGGRLVTILRDDIPTIPFPGHWDLPGGGIEAGETPRAAVLREIEEEIALKLAPSRLTWSRDFPRPDGRVSHFFAAALSPGEVEAIRLGAEGQDWRMMEVEAFVAHHRAVPHFRPRVAAWAEECLGG